MTNLKHEAAHLSVVKPGQPGSPTREERIAKRVPIAEWVNGNDKWNIEDYINEISNYLFETYGVVEEHNRHLIAILAGHIDTYIKCTRSIMDDGILADFNDGQTVGANIHINIRAKLMPVIIALMNELGLTPKSKLTPKSNGNNNELAKMLKGPKG